MSKKVRVRFAPSPTGALHIGGVRTALFNYLFAKKHKGDFILRIEDTDQKRYVAAAEDYIVEALNWCGITIDEGVSKGGEFGPYRQSERKEMYLQYAQQLIDNGHAYYAFDTAEELDQLRTAAENEKKTFIYNHEVRAHLNNSLNLSAEETAARIKTDNYVIRFKTPTNETLYLKDIIRGQVQFETNVLDDKVLFKNDGMPTYHLANIVDDHLMQITHVIRGEEWLPSMPLHVQMYKALGWDEPEFAHLPLILKPVGNGKLSKRDGDKLGFPVFPIQWETESGIANGYKEDGFYPEAVVNFLALLGWNDGTEKELFSMDELIQSFDLSRVNKSGAKFDPEKNKWFNHQYLIVRDSKLVTEEFIAINKDKIGDKYTKEQLVAIVDSIKERASFTNELWELSSFYFEAPHQYDDKAYKKAIKEDTAGILEGVITTLESIDSFTAENIQNEIKNWMTAQELGFGKVMQPLRLSLVGEMKGPDVFDIIAILGKEETIQRIQKIIA
jgi:glutamyl-tRNA synthetase